MGGLCLRARLGDGGGRAIAQTEMLGIICLTIRQGLRRIAGGRMVFADPVGSQTLCFSLALWNGRDPILKERLFGLNPYEGNHGGNVKEYYYYLDATPTHSYMKFLYRYPHNAYPYERLVQSK